jgi:hypothetical protein
MSYLLARLDRAAAMARARRPHATPTLFSRHLAAATALADSHGRDSVQIQSRLGGALRAEPGLAECHGHGLTLLAQSRRNGARR